MSIAHGFRKMLSNRIFSSSSAATSSSTVVFNPLANPRIGIFSPGSGLRGWPTVGNTIGGLFNRAMGTIGRGGRPLKYKVRKGRCSKGFKADGSYLSFGKYGIKSCENGRISSRAIEAARRAIIGQFRRKGKVWIRVYADIPITKKPTEVRMGRGKGNVAGWIARVSTGQILFEMDGVSLPDAKQAAVLASHKLCVPTKFMIYS